MATAEIRPTPAHQLGGVNANNITTTDNSTPASSFPSGPVEANLSFYAPPEDGSKPYNWVETPTDGSPQRNFGSADHIVPISDLRGQENAFTLDANAFAALKAIPSRMSYSDWESDATIKSIYYPEVESLLLSRLPGAHRVVLFDHTIRRAVPNAHRAPVTRVHIDQTPSSTAARIRLHAPEEAEELLQGRYRIVNVWRPLRGPVESFPLAVADSATVRDRDLVPVEHRYPDRTGETAQVHFNAEQKWYYWSGMTEEERLLLKCFDSDVDVGRWGRVPHSAFVDPRSAADAQPRESIEVRALVFG